MKIIGEKLSKQEMLNVKGGASFTCECTSGPNSGDTWTADYDTAPAIVAGIASNCGTFSNGSCSNDDQQEQ